MLLGAWDRSAGTDKRESRFMWMRWRIVFRDGHQRQFGLFEKLVSESREEQFELHQITLAN
jgi:hypothetical protein